MRIETRFDSRLAPARAWARLTDWPAHSRFVPLTKVTVTHDTGGLGTRFVGRSGVGPLAFDDPMEVVRFEPPTATSSGRCEVRKLGRLVTGTAGFDVEPAGGGSRVTWFEDIEIWPRSLFQLLAPVVVPLGNLSFRQVLVRALN